MCTGHRASILRQKNLHFLTLLRNLPASFPSRQHLLTDLLRGCAGEYECIPSHVQCLIICTLTRSTLLLTASMLIISPFSTSAIGPPTNASGVTWPIMIPWDAPLKRLSVIKGPVFPRPAPTSAEPGLNISGMPGLHKGEGCVSCVGELSIQLLYNKQKLKLKFTWNCSYSDRCGKTTKAWIQDKYLN